jgi:hypothetical protein
MTATEYRIMSPEVLAEFRARGDEPKFWADRWRDIEYRRYLARYERGYLAQFGRVFRRHLPKEGRILERQIRIPGRTMSRPDSIESQLDFISKSIPMANYPGF